MKTKKIGKKIENIGEIRNMRSVWITSWNRPVASGFLLSMRLITVLNYFERGWLFTVEDIKSKRKGKKK